MIGLEVTFLESSRHCEERVLSEDLHKVSQLEHLLSLFYANSSVLGHFEKISVDQCPTVYKSLLAHCSHMTVTVERHHGEQVNLEVLSETKADSLYQRKIALRRSSDQRVVQFGIVQLDLNCLTSVARTQVLDGTTPLGRVLIQNQILTEVQLCDLWKVHCGPELTQIFQVKSDAVTYGRSARLLMDDKQGIELLEIVAPEPALADKT